MGERNSLSYIGINIDEVFVPIFCFIELNGIQSFAQAKHGFCYHFTNKAFKIMMFAGELFNSIF